MDDLIQCCYDWFDNYNYFVVREKKFNPKGRIHNEIESKEIDAAMRKILAAKNIPYKQIIGKDKAVDFVVSDYLQQRKI
jgi:metal-dependent HD superfamily phosphatase/phosphodiesterase